MLQTWPESICFKTFSQVIRQDKKHIYTQLYLRHPFAIQNQTIAVKNLQKICEATFKLANESGFQAMTLRQLSKQTSMSMGGLYAYIQSKDDLAQLIYSFLDSYCNDAIQLLVRDDLPVGKKLIALIHGHIYLSEQLQPWFYFAYMETKNLSKTYKKLAIQSEIKMETKLLDVIKKGFQQGEFRNKALVNDPSGEKLQLTVSLVKAMLQDWYLKRWKYNKRMIRVDDYATQVVDITLKYLHHD